MIRQLSQTLGFAAMRVLTSAHHASAFRAHFLWSGISACSRTSPAFTIRDALEGMASLRFMMSDKDAPNFRHGGSTVRYDGSGRVPEGAIDYIGPARRQAYFSAMSGTLEALDKSGKMIARAAAEGRFPVR
jgi:hypothetical protein